MFEAIGWDRHEEELYLEILREPGRTVAELIAALPDHPEAMTATALSSLVSQGLATSMPGEQPRRYVPIAPDVALGGLTRRVIERVHHVQDLIPELMRHYWTAHWRGDGTDFVEVVAGDRAMVRTRLLQLQGAAEKSVRMLVREPYHTDPTTPANIEFESLGRGVQYQVVYEQSELEDSSRWPEVMQGIADGEEARIYDGLPVKLDIVDGRIATTPLMGRYGEHAGTLVIHGSPLLDALSALFEAYWERAVPLVGVDGRPVLSPTTPGTADALDDELVRLLATGVTDDGIARTLGVSRSTVQRRVNGLMSAHGAKTRFQLGLQLGRAATVS